MGGTMSSLVLSGDTSGTVTLAVPAVAGTNTVTIAAQTGTLNAAGPTFSAYQNSATSFAAGAWQKIQFQAKEWDTANAFDNTTNYRFTPPVAGYYQVNSRITASPTGGTFGISIYKNGSIWKRGVVTLNGAGEGISVNCLVYLNGSTDYIETWAYFGNSGLNSYAGSDQTYFQASLVRGA